MGEGTMLRVLTVVQVLRSATAVFFHEQSSVLLKPFPNPDGYSDFGFAMGYNSVPHNLVVGAPRVDNMGKIFSCDMEAASTRSEIDCDENLIDFETLAEYSRTVNPDQYFFTGSSIVATSDYFFTCAPMWTSDVETSDRVRSNAFGTCFMQNSTDTYRYQGTLERYLKMSRSVSGNRISYLDSFLRGTGWSTLGDEENDLLLIVKSSMAADFVYTHLSTPLKETTSLILKSPETLFFWQHYNNIGYGITAGKIFSRNKTVYPFSMELQDMRGAISFLEYNSKANILSIIRDSGSEYMLINEAIGAMFGSAMAPADLNMDGLDELLVGAPALSEENCVECGALHIYLGGEMKTLEHKDRLRTILGTEEFGRFGTAMTANDLDGDSISEIAVSAPYENEGRGAVYILSGYELHRTIIKYSIYKCIQVSDLKLTQRILQEPYKLLGFSLQFVADVDRNGCDELVAGAPGNGSAVLFKCIQTMNVTISNALIGKQVVKEQDHNFTVQVCAQVQLPELPSDIVGNISVVSSIVGDGTYIKKPRIFFDISCKNCTRSRLFCENITVGLSEEEPGDYTFKSEAVLHTDKIFARDVATTTTEIPTTTDRGEEPTSEGRRPSDNSTWIVTSPYSHLVDTIEIPRHCGGEDCKAKLSMEFVWSGSKTYVLGSTSNEVVTVHVRNDGSESYEACVWLRVTGAPLTRVGCQADNNWYRCYLPKPLGRHKEHSINLLLDMTMPTNAKKELRVEALLSEKCNWKNTNDSNFQVVYGMTTDNIVVNGVPHNRNITDTQVYNNDVIFNVQEYLITNNGKITWNNVPAYISIEKKRFMGSIKVSDMDSSNCEPSSVGSIFTFKCIIDLNVNSTQKVTVSIEILANEIKPDILYNERLNMSSELELHLQPTEVIKNASVITQMKLEKEWTFGNNKLLISLIAFAVALLILAIVIIVLYKAGFFRRKQKQRLHVLRESIKQQHSRRNTHTSAREGQTDYVEGLQMDVDEDPFDVIPIPIRIEDDINLVENKASGHK